MSGADPRGPDPVSTRQGTGELPGGPEGWGGPLAEWMAAQRWYPSGVAPLANELSVRWSERLWSDSSGQRALWQLLVAVGDQMYQVLLGQRPDGELAEFLHGHESAVVVSLGGYYYYEATLDAEMCLWLLKVVGEGRIPVARARRLVGEQTNTSVVYDDKVILKAYRRLAPGPNPDAEVVEALHRVGFEHVARPLARFVRHGYDCALVQEYLSGGTEGWAMALTSLRDLCSSDAGTDPAEAGGDFSAEAARLGRVTAELHLALRTAFPEAVGSAVEPWRQLRQGLGARLAEVDRREGTSLARAAQPLLARLDGLADPGPAQRVHGDLHLGQVMRTDGGWYVLDFEGEPARPLAERTRPAPVLKDVAGMLRSVHYAARYALMERAGDFETLEEPLLAWEERNRAAFLEGYLAQPGVAALLPGSAEAVELARLAYELDKALYEYDYECSYRPGWRSIPLAGLARMVGSATGGNT